MLTISGKALGRRRPLFADFSIHPPAGLSGDGGVTLRQLVGHVVRAEVGAFQDRQRDRALFRTMTARQIADAAETGRVAAGPSDVPPQAIDADAAAAVAIQAFEDGLYLVVVDGQQACELDRQIYLRPDSQLTFIRLVLLAGG
jgi:hypothetical protein